MLAAYSGITLALIVLVSAVVGVPLDTASVAFSVGLGSTQYLNGNDIVRFDTVYLNDHASYDVNTGVFMCPLAGLYVFHVHAYNSNKDMRPMWLELQLNNEPVVSVSGVNSHTVSGNSVILRLKRNDVVHIRSKEEQAFTLFGLPDQVYSTFSGFMIGSPSYNQESSIFGK